MMHIIGRNDDNSDFNLDSSINREREMIDRMKFQHNCAIKNRKFLRKEISVTPAHGPHDARACVSYNV